MTPDPSSSGDGLFAEQGAQDFAAIAGPAEPKDGGTPAPQETSTNTPAQVTPGQVTPPAQQTPAPGAPVAPVTPAAPNYDAIIKSTVDATANAFRQNQLQQPTPQPQPISAQDFDRKYGIVRPNEQMLNQIMGQDPKQAVATLDSLFQANLTAALRMSNDLVEAKLSELNGRYEPHLKSWQQHQQQQANQAAEDSFFKKNPDLVVERDLVMEMKDAFLTKVAAGQVRFNNTDEAFSAVANATRAILSKTRGAQTGGQTQAGQNQDNGGGVVNNPPAGRQMSAASSAGRTGTGQAAAKKSIVDEVFGEDAR